MKGYHVRLPKPLKDKVDEVATEQLKSRTQVVVDVLQAWVAAGARTPLGSLRRVLEVLDQLVAIMSFADHALSRSQFPWAIREYRRLQIAAEESGAAALVQYSLYRQAYCNWAFAVRLRKAALTNVGSRHDEARAAAKYAAKSVKRSIDINKKFLKKEEQALVRFNLACVHSFYAALLVEIAFMNDQEWRRRLEDGTRIWTEDSDSLANVWRDAKIFETESICEHGQAALKALEILTTEPVVPVTRDPKRSEEWTSICPTDRDWLVRQTKNDEDLAFVRNDRKFKEEFDTWYESRNLPSDELSSLRASAYLLDEILEDPD